MRNPADQLDQLLAPVFDVAEAAKAPTIATGLPGRTGRGVRTNLSQRRPGGGRGEQEGAGAARPRRDVARGSQRHDRGGRHPDGARRCVVACRPGGPSDGQGVCLRRRRRWKSTTRRARSRSGGQTFKEGEWLSIDGTAGKVFAGRVKTAPSEIVAGLIEGNAAAQADGEVQELPAADEMVRSRRPGCRCAPTPTRPNRRANAIAFGAVGIGLCRTEHMFFEGNRIDAMREMILAETLESRKAALAKLLPYQRDDFAGIFRALKGYPATIRFLDPPLHEFLPHTPEQQADLSKKIGVPVEKIHLRVEQLHEFNPMLGLRGCRLGIDYPGDLRDAGARRLRGGGDRAEGRHQGPSGNHDPARRLQEGARSAARDRSPRRARKCRPSGR